MKEEVNLNYCYIYGINALAFYDFLSSVEGGFDQKASIDKVVKYRMGEDSIAPPVKKQNLSLRTINMFNLMKSLVFLEEKLLTHEAGNISKDAVHQ